MEEHHSHAHAANKNPLGQLEQLLDEYLGRKAPQIPHRWREWLVTAIPWITLIAFILTLPAIFLLLGLGTLLIPASVMFGSVGYGSMHALSIVFLAIVLLLELFALPGLFKRRYSGWKLVFYASLVSIVQNILFFSIGGILGGIIGLWILFQIKNYYK